MTFAGPRCPVRADAPQARTFEQERLHEALAGLDLAPDPQAEGKQVAYVRVVRRDVFQEGELFVDWLTWFNHFHFLTDERVVRRELRVTEGERFRHAAAAETARNLRALGIFSLVQVIPVRHPDPDKVGVVVYTRDLWSLRLETTPEITDSTFALYTQLVERNFLGLNKSAALRFDWRVLTFSVGELYADYRLLGERLQLVESADLIFNNDSGALEGGVASLSLGRPFYNLDQRWAFDVSAAGRALVSRFARRGEQAYVDLLEEGADCDPQLVTCAPAVYDERQGNIRASGSMRVGYAYKQTYTLGLVYQDHWVAPNEQVVLPPELEEVFVRRVLPRTRRQVGPFARYRLMLPRYARFQNLASYGRAETVQVGPELDAFMLFPLAAFGSTEDAYQVSASASYVLAGAGALLDARVYAGARLERGQVVNQYAGARVRAASPPWFWGRLVLSSQVLGRRRDTARTPVALGNDSGLRGYPSGSFLRRGASWMLTNLEYRTLPIDIESVHLGFVGFYDVGGIARQLRRLPLYQSVGVGVRLYFPQLNRFPFRLDVGVPVGSGAEGFEVRLSLGGDQVIPLTPEEDRLAASRDIRDVNNL